MGIGKTTIARILANKLKAKHYEIDRILNKNNIKEWENGSISIKSFIKANEISAKKAMKDLESWIPIIFEGNFYFKEQIEDLIKRLNYPHYIFTLKAPLDVCITRDNKREKTLGKEAAIAVYKKTNSFDYGIVINAENKTEKEIVEEILCYLK